MNRRWGLNVGNWIEGTAHVHARSWLPLICYIRMFRADQAPLVTAWVFRLALGARIEIV